MTNCRLGRHDTTPSGAVFVERFPMHALTVAADLVSGLSRQSRGSGQFALVGVEGKKLGGTEVQCRSHVQHVDGAMSGTRGVLCGKPLGEIDHVCPVRW